MFEALHTPAPRGEQERETVDEPAPSPPDDSKFAEMINCFGSKSMSARPFTYSAAEDTGRLYSVPLDSAGWRLVSNGTTMVCGVSPPSPADMPRLIRAGRSDVATVSCSNACSTRSPESEALPISAVSQVERRRGSRLEAGGPATVLGAAAHAAAGSPSPIMGRPMMSRPRLAIRSQHKHNGESSGCFSGTISSMRGRQYLLFWR
mmetsp:Transcript_7160/g.12029  ORF Transcript_7160/g.12029 Transcript_7160/m.12029 type:complete len:205 (-) Transcript_7160:831-1445(-)